MKAARGIAMGFLLVVGLAAAAPELWAPVPAEDAQNGVRGDSFPVVSCGARRTLCAPYETQFRDSPDARPSTRFPLGSDALGRDRLTRLLYGTRVSLSLAPAAALLSCLGAAVLGGTAGLAGGWADTAILALADLFLSLPWLFLLLIARACLPLNVPPATSLAITFLLLGALGWAAPARVVRASVRTLKNSGFLFQARAAGCRPWRLLWRHLLPNVMPVLTAQFWVAVPAYILAETTLGMLGLGLAEPLPSWGGLLRELEGGGIMTQPWLLSTAMLVGAVTGGFHLAFPGRRERL